MSQLLKLLKKIGMVGYVSLSLTSCVGTIKVPTTPQILACIELLNLGNEVYVDIHNCMIKGGDNVQACLDALLLAPDIIKDAKMCLSGESALMQKMR